MDKLKEPSKIIWKVSELKEDTSVTQKYVSKDMNIERHEDIQTERLQDK